MKFPMQHVEYWPLERLVPFEKNPRTHCDAQIVQIGGYGSTVTPVADQRIRKAA